MSIFCTQCGKANEVTSKFCFNCGTPTVVTSGIVVQPAFSAFVSAPKPAQAHPIIPAPATTAETEKITEEVLKLTGVRGWLRFLVVVLMVIGPLVALGSFGSAQGDIKPLVTDYPAFGVLLEVTGWFTGLMIIWSIYVGYRLAKGYQNAPVLAKWYFVLLPVGFVVQSIVMLNITGLPKASIEAMGSGLALEFIKTLFSSIVWYLYLIRSKRVRYTYPDPATHVRCPDCSQFVFSKSAACPHCKAKLRPQ